MVQVQQGSPSPGETDLLAVRRKLDAILKERAQAFPYRDPENTRALREAASRYAEMLSENPSTEWSPDSGLCRSAQELAGQPVFLCGYLKSGTSLLLELLDGHPELLVMPGDSHMARLIKRQPDQPDGRWEQQWAHRWLTRWVNPKGQEPFWILGREDGPYKEFLHWLRHWLLSLPPSRTRPFLAVVLAYYCANPLRPPTPKSWVEKTPRNERRVSDLLQWFPKARFLHIVRHPFANLASMKRLCAVRRWRWHPIQTALSIRRSAYLGYQNQRQVGTDRYQIIRYEGLVADPESTMREVSAFLGIRFDTSMLTPTVNGMLARANSMYRDGQVLGQIKSRKPGRWREELSAFERMAALLVFSPVPKLFQREPCAGMGESQGIGITS
jgi:hypothetical protein